MDLIRLELLLSLLGIDILDLEGSLGTDLLPAPEDSGGGSGSSSVSSSDSSSVKQNKRSRSVSRIFENLTPGATATVSANSGNTFGPATVVNFDPDTSTVTLAEIDSASTPSTKVTIINSEEIESVSFTN